MTGVHQTVFTLVGLVLLGQPQAPPGWSLNGSHPIEYTVSADYAAAYNGQRGVVIASTGNNPEAWVQLHQVVHPRAFEGKRVRFSGYIKSEGVEGWAGLRFEVRGGWEVFGVDNMKDRPIRGDRDWYKYESVLDVPDDDAIHIEIGIALHGVGKIYLDDFRFEVVDESVPTTGEEIPPSLPPEPVNLDFENE